MSPRAQLVIVAVLQLFQYLLHHFFSTSIADSIATLLFSIIMPTPLIGGSIKR